MMHPLLLALDFVASSLSAADSSESTADLRERIRSGRLSWGAVIDLSNRFLVAPALWSALRRRRLTAEIPPLARNYLQEMHRLNSRRNARLREQVIEAAETFNRAGIEPVLLKGASHLFTDIFGDPGTRLMTDIDLLVEKEQFEAALAILRELGYQEYGEVKKRRREHHHHPALFRPGDYATLELHHELVFHTARAILPAPEGLEQALEIDAGGLRLKALSPTCQVLHSILHSEVVDRRHAQGLIGLRNLHDLSFLQRHFGATIDWEHVRSKMESHGKGHILRSYLFLARRLLNMPIPVEMSAGWRERLHERRCRARIAWGWWTIIEECLEKFSAENICAIYGCSDALLPVMAGRLRYAAYLIVKCNRMGWKKALAMGMSR